MATAPNSARKILFVDDDPDFLDMIRRMMGSLSQGQWEILTAETAGQALSLAQKQVLHLVVIDVQMPVVDGLQLLTLLNRKHPNLQKVVLTGFATEAYRAACLSNGAELFLEKPRSREEQESLFATLNELMKWQPEEGFRGVLRRVGLQDVIQMECLSGNSSVLEIKGRKGQGRIFIKEGAIVHAEAGERKGELAFNYLLALKGGEFWVKPFADPPEQTMQGQWEFLLMEAARMRDEIAETELSEAPLPGPEIEEPLPDVALTGMAGDAPGPVEGGPAEVTEIRDLSAPAAEGRPLIEEIFLCTAHGEVLYEWQCRNSDLWVNFFEFLSRKSHRLAQGLPLGAFRRLETRGDQSRIVALITREYGALVRSRKESL